MLFLLSHWSLKTKRPGIPKEKSFGSSAPSPPEDPSLSSPFSERVGVVGIYYSGFIYNIRRRSCQILFVKAYHLKLLFEPLFVYFCNLRLADEKMSGMSLMPCVRAKQRSLFQGGILTRRRNY
jgi:hypothetical protein